MRGTEQRIESGGVSTGVRSCEVHKPYTAPNDSAAIKNTRPTLTMSAPDHPEIIRLTLALGALLGSN